MDQTVLFERDTELARLVRVAELAASGTGSIVVISGEPGSGKSSLVRAMGDAAGQYEVRASTDVAGHGTGAQPLIAVVEDLDLADESTLSHVSAVFAGSAAVWSPPLDRVHRDRRPSGRSPN